MEKVKKLGIKKIPINEVKRLVFYAGGGTCVWICGSPSGDTMTCKRVCDKPVY